MSISRKFIDDLLTQVNIVDVINPCVSLTKKGQNHMACCPFHTEKTPSFSVNAAKQFYHCFGCGASGSAVKFLMEYQNFSFVEAIEELAQQYSMEVVYDKTKKNSNNYQPLLDTLGQANTYYQQQLKNNTDANQYIKQRTISTEIAQRFSIGYAPQNFDYLQSAFTHDYNEKLLLNTGLLKQKNGKSYAGFRHRLMFPIRNRRGQTIGFGGRVISDKDQPKYLNSPETEVFKKRNNLYGTYELKYAKKLNHIIIVEGYMDVISLACHHINNVVATLGTSVTKEHIQQLFRICNHLIFCFDGDNAGRKAAVTALQQSITVFRDGYEIKFMFLPEKEDPDSIVKNQGKTGFDNIAKQATPLSSFLFTHLCENLDMETPEGKSSFTERARPLLTNMPPSTFRDMMIKDLIEKTGVTSNHLTETVQKNKLNTKTGRQLRQKKRRYTAMRVIAIALVNNPQLAEDKRLNCKEIRILQQPAAQFIANLIEEILTNNITSTASLLEVFRDKDKEATIMQLATQSSAGKEDDNSEFSDAVNALNVKILQYKQELIIAKIEKQGLKDLNQEEKKILQTLSSVDKNQ